MNEFSAIEQRSRQPLDPAKFRDPMFTAKGEPRASVALDTLATLWINTGTLCNIACANCYIESSPANDRLVYITAAEARRYLDEIPALGLATREIGFTGGEPFMNPDMLPMAADALDRGFNVLVLTNAMQPMQRRHIREGLLTLRARHGSRLTLRVSLDHYTRALHEAERGPNTWDKTLSGLKWLSDNRFTLDVAGRTCWGEPEDAARDGYARLFARTGIRVDAHDTRALTLFPEMDETEDVPEITTSCWDVLGVNPADMMCATSRMVVKRKGAQTPVVVPCTLLPYGPEFTLGETLAEALGATALNHPHCAKFCVLGGGSCSAGG